MSNVKITGLPEVLNNYEKWRSATLTKAEREMARVGLDFENYGKNNRPWTDRTGNARRSISSQTSRDPQSISTSIGIGVEYGVYLELAHGGKYRIVSTTIDTFRSSLLDRLTRAVQ